MRDEGMGRLGRDVYVRSVRSVRGISGDSGRMVDIGM